MIERALVECYKLMKMQMSNKQLGNPLKTSVSACEIKYIVDGLQKIAYIISNTKKNKVEIVTEKSKYVTSSIYGLIYDKPLYYNTLYIDSKSKDEFCILSEKSADIIREKEEIIWLDQEIVDTHFDKVNDIIYNEIGYLYKIELTDTIIDSCNIEQEANRVTFKSKVYNSSASINIDFKVNPAKYDEPSKMLYVQNLQHAIGILNKIDSKIKLHHDWTIKMKDQLELDEHKRRLTGQIQRKIASINNVKDLEEFSLHLHKIFNKENIKDTV